jgi:hypothetical protein
LPFLFRKNWRLTLQNFAITAGKYTQKWWTWLCAESSANSVFSGNPTGFASVILYFKMVPKKSWLQWNLDLLYRVSCFLYLTLKGWVDKELKTQKQRPLNLHLSCLEVSRREMHVHYHRKFLEMNAFFLFQTVYKTGFILFKTWWIWERSLLCLHKHSYLSIMSLFLSQTNWPKPPIFLINHLYFWQRSPPHMLNKTLMLKQGICFEVPLFIPMCL